MNLTIRLHCEPISFFNLSHYKLSVELLPAIPIVAALPEPERKVLSECVFGELLAYGCDVVLLCLQLVCVQTMVAKLPFFTSCTFTLSVIVINVAPPNCGAFFYLAIANTDPVRPSLSRRYG